MIKMTGESVIESKYAKFLITGSTKMGKTVTMMAMALGLMPWQKYGGVCAPQDLHLLGFDEATAQGVNTFFKMLNAPPEAYKYTYWNMQDDVRSAMRTQNEYDYTFYNKVMQVIRDNILPAMHRRPGGVLIPSSLTTLGLALERSVAGPAGIKPGGGMDQSKWGDFARQVTDIRSEAQVDTHHCLWEAHIYKPPNTSQNKDAEKEESLQVSGKAGFNFPNNVGAVFRLQRKRGQVHPGTKIDQMFFDTRTEMAYTGRCVTEQLRPQEVDLTYMISKLGHKVTFWGRKAEAK